jgi:hypothetical protein
MASETDELRRACDRWVAEATVERRSAEQRQVWPPARRARRALETAPCTPPRTPSKITSPRTPTNKIVAVVKGSVSLFCPQPSTTSPSRAESSASVAEPLASVVEPSASATDDPYTGTTQRPALSAKQRAAAELAAARMMQQMAIVDVKLATMEQLVEADDAKAKLEALADGKQLGEIDDTQVVIDIDELGEGEGDEQQLDELHVKEDAYQQSDAEYRRAEKRADADFPPWTEPWQDRSSPPAPSVTTRGAPPAKRQRWLKAPSVTTRGAPPAKRQRFVPYAPRACAIGAKPQPAKPQHAKKQPPIGLCNRRYKHNVWHDDEKKTAWHDEKKTDWHDDEKKTDWHDEENKTDWREEKKTDWHASNTMWHDEKKTDWYESKTDGHDEEKKTDWYESKTDGHDEETKTDWYDETNKSDWAGMMDAAIQRWRSDGHAQAANTGRKVKRRAGAKIQEKRKLLASEPATIKALLRAQTKEASHRDLDVLFATFGPRALEELLAGEQKNDDGWQASA